MKLKLRNRLMMFVALAVTLLIFSPWQIDFYDRFITKAYQIGLWAMLSISCLYFFWIIETKIIWVYFSLKVFFFTLLVFSGIGLVLAVRTAPIYKGTYLLLFSKPENSNETIEIVHHHGFIKGWNQIKHLKSFPNLGFRIEKKIDHEDVTGNWIVHPDNPFHEKTGVFYFKNGEIVQ